MTGRSQKPLAGGEQGYFKGKRPVNVRVDDGAIQPEMKLPIPFRCLRVVDRAWQQDSRSLFGRLCLQIRCVQGGRSVGCIHE